MQQLERFSLWQVVPGVLVTDLGTELVLLQPQTAQMYQLSATSRVLWQALPGSLHSLARRLTEHYAVSPELAEADTRRLIEQLAERQLIEQAAP